MIAIPSARTKSMRSRVLAHPLVLVVLDVGDMAILERGIVEGFLPAISAIAGRGFHTRYCGNELVAEMGTPLTALSGVSRLVHGHYSYRELEPGGYGFRNRNAQCPGQPAPFWEALRGTDASVAIVDPPEFTTVTGLDGVQLCHWYSQEAAASRLPARSEPPEFLSRAARRLRHKQWFDNFLFQSPLAKDKTLHRRMLRRVARKGAFFRDLLTERSYDLMVLGFADTHTAGHRFIKYRERLAGAARDEEMRDSLRDLYVAIDQQIGHIIEICGTQSHVIVTSFSDIAVQFPTEGLTETFLLELGYAAPCNQPEHAHPRDVARRVLPLSWRKRIGKRLPVAWQEHLLSWRSHDCHDWRRTRVFAIPGMYQSYLRVNLRGREPEGIVTPGAEYEELLTGVESDLKALIDPVSGQPAVTSVVRTSTHFGCQPPDKLPDLFVDWRQTDYFMETVMHPRATLHQSPPHYFRESAHTYDGFLAVAGPHIAAGDGPETVELLDLAPTCLGLLGIEPPARMSGHALPCTTAR